MLHGAPFLFSQALRERHVHATAFGPSRAVVNMQAELLHALETVSPSGYGGGAGLELKLDKWVIRRDPAAVFMEDVRHLYFATCFDCLCRVFLLPLPCVSTAFALRD